jgi:uncharacterized protein (TIGR03905 family)
MPKHFIFNNEGTCSSSVEFDLVEGAIHDVRFQGGCSGNLQGVAALVEGMPAADAIERLSGIRCGGNATSCPDQFARALTAALAGRP